MKKIFIFLTLLFVTHFSFPQNSGVARGAESGELYLANYWYGIFAPTGPPEYTELRNALFRITENGKKITIQYDADHFAGFYTEPGSVMQPRVILADATSGVVYNKDTYYKNGYSYNSLWTSFDYGKNWVFREENKWPQYYYSANFEGLLYRGRSESNDYGESFPTLKFGTPRDEPGLKYGEAFIVETSASYKGQLMHTYDFYETYSTIPIDSQYVFGQLHGWPDVYRGALPGEVYIDSWFPDDTYKVSFSADTGHNFKHVYQCKTNCFIYGGLIESKPFFMSDREPGVFYILRRYEVEDKDPWGWHLKLCIEYYRDYGETLVATYCHDVTKDYGNGVGITEKGEGAGDEVVLYPNPTTGELQVTSYKLQVTSVEVFDVYGRKILVPPLTVLRSYDLTVLRSYGLTPRHLLCSRGF